MWNHAKFIKPTNQHIILCIFKKSYFIDYGLLIYDDGLFIDKYDVAHSVDKIKYWIELPSFPKERKL